VILDKYEPKKLKKFTSPDEDELIAIMEGVGYCWAEIQEKINRKREKYGVVVRQKKKEEKRPTDSEIKRKQYLSLLRKREEDLKKEMTLRWKIVRSEPFKRNPQDMYNWMLRPVNKIELEHDYKKQVRTHFNKSLTDWLIKKWSYNERMGD
jgi:hypothetical protein